MIKKNKKVLKGLGYFLGLILLGIVIQVGFAYILNALLMGVEALNEAGEEYGQFESNYRVSAKMIVYTIAAAPIIEELVFRLGLIGLGGKIIRNFAIVNVIQALLFGFYHGNNIQIVYAAILGLVLGYIFKYLGGYLASVIVHVSINASGIYLVPLCPELSLQYMVLVGVVALGISAIIILRLKKHKR